MPDFEISNPAAVGLIYDIPSHQLPPEAWNMAEGVRFRNGRALRRLGWSAAFGTPTVAPHFVMGMLDSVQQTWWLYTSLTKAYVYRGGTHSNITRQTASVDVDYTASKTQDWGGTILGGIPILNNGADVPQYWASFNAATKLQDLNNWPSTLRAKRVVAFGPYLFALNCTKSGSSFPHMVKWSHPAAPGSLPISWDETDPAKDTGEYDLPSTGTGVILTGLPLHDQLFIYKEGTVWRARFVGGRAVFSFFGFLHTAGIVAPRAVCLTPDASGHVFVTAEDIIYHNGQQPQSIATSRVRDYFFGTLNVEAKDTIFCFANRFAKEVWICFPQGAATQPNQALIWQMEENVWSSIAINFRHAATGPVESAVEGTWDGAGTNTWDSDTAVWSSTLGNAVVVAVTDETGLAICDAGYKRFNSDSPVVLQRTGLSLLGKDRSGNPIVDFKQWKLFTRVWLTAVGVFQIRLGTQDLPEGPVDWQEWQDFDADVDLYLDFIQSGRAVALEIRHKGEEPFAIDAYRIELVKLGNF
jgi:hypothetical protein